ENLGWRRVEVRRILGELIDYPVTIETMLNGMNWSQRLAADSASGNMLLVSVALGIGASLIIDGRLTRGSGFAAGQLGHVRSRSSNLPCVCGRTGCLDTTASGRAILKAHGLLGTGNPFPVRALSSRFAQLSSAAQSRPEVAEAF